MLDTIVSKVIKRCFNISKKEVLQPPLLVLFCTSMIKRKFETSKYVLKIAHIFELLVRYAGVYARDIIGVEKSLKKVFGSLKRCKEKVKIWKIY